MARIDNMGRLGIPLAIRNNLGINGVTEVDIIENNNNEIIIKPKFNIYRITENEMTSLRKLYIMLNESGLVSGEYKQVLSNITKESESVCGVCGNKLFADGSSLKCYKCN